MFPVVAGVGVVDKEMYSMYHVVPMSGYETPWADLKDSDLRGDRGISEALQDGGVLMKNAAKPSLSNVLTVLTRDNFDKAIRHRGSRAR